MNKNTNDEKRVCIYICVGHNTSVSKNLKLFVKIGDFLWNSTSGPLGAKHITGSSIYSRIKFSDGPFSFSSFIVLLNAGTFRGFRFHSEVVRLFGLLLFSPTLWKSFSFWDFHAYVIDDGLFKPKFHKRKKVEGTGSTQSPLYVTIRYPSPTMNVF